MRKIFVVIVNYNEKNNTLAVLKQLENIRKVRFVPVVVDNNSTDGSIAAIKKQFPKVILIANNKNIGFAKGVNKVVRLGLYQKADYFWLLNPDTIVPKDFLLKILKKKADIVGPVIRYKREGKWIYDLGGYINWQWGRAEHSDNGRDIDYISGCCVLIKKDVFEKIGLFDERFFLYYEDTDFCTRAKKAGFSLVVEPSVVITHHLKGQEQNSHKPFFNIYHNLRSNLCFIFKYQKGISLFFSLLYFSTLVLKVLFNQIKWLLQKNLLLLGILSVAIFLRSYDISNTLPFTHEIGRDYLSAKTIAFDHQIALLGPPSSHTWLFHGPVFYYLLAFALLLFAGSPFAGYFLILLGDLLTLIALYFFGKKLFGKNVGLITVLFGAVFPISVALARIPAHYALVPLFSLVAFGCFLVYQSTLKQRWLIFSALSTGLAVQLHLSSIIIFFFVAIILAIYKRLKEILLFLIFFMLPLLPIFIYDLGQNFFMTRMLLLWFPYRVIKFSWQSWQLVVLLLFTSGVIFWFLTRVKKNLVTLLLFVSFTLLLLFWHGNPPIHYFYFLLPEIIILAGLLTANIGSIKNILAKLIFVIIVVVWTGGSLVFFFRNYLPEQRQLKSYPIPLIDQEKAVILILNDAQNRPFRLQRFGDLDIFNGYLDNYRYLVWWLGKREEEKSALLTYTIYEDQNKFKKFANLNNKFFYLQRVTIEKSTSL